MGRRDPTKLNTSNLPLEAYDFIRKWLTLASVAATVALFLINAPFGRFVPTGSTRSRHPVAWFNSRAFMFNGIRTWIVMELVAPITFILAFLKSPLSFYRVALPDPFSPQGLLVILFLAHYLNRALISPLRTPSRSKSHIIVPIVGITFNLANGYTLGSYFSSPYARIYLGGQYAFDRPTFRIGVALWVIGLIGNIAHDEILLNIRKKAQARKEKDAATKADGESKAQSTEEHYGIPTGGFYQFISYPNYFFEWIEWFGFALAAAPFPIQPDFSTISTAPTLERAMETAVLKIIQAVLSTFVPLFTPYPWIEIMRAPAYSFAPALAPPWIFLINLFMLMLPRAIKGHAWYKERFGASYPKNRKAVIPFLI